MREALSAEPVSVLHNNHTKTPTHLISMMLISHSVEDVMEKPEWFEKRDGMFTPTSKNSLATQECVLSFSFA